MGRRKKKKRNVFLIGVLCCGHDISRVTESSSLSCLSMGFACLALTESTQTHRPTPMEEVRESCLSVRFLKMKLEKANCFIFFSVKIFSV